MVILRVLLATGLDGFASGSSWSISPTQENDSGAEHVTFVPGPKASKS